MITTDGYLFRPFLGHASCGLFGISEDYEENVLSLDELMIKSDVSTFFFKAEGNSMEPTIFDGDILVVDTSMKATHGKIVVCELDGQRICKRLFFSKVSRLASDNPKFKSLNISSEMDLTIFGVVTGVARRL